MVHFHWTLFLVLCASYVDLLFGQEVGKCDPSEISPTSCTASSCSNRQLSCQKLECVVGDSCDSLELSDSEIFCSGSFTCGDSLFTRSIVFCSDSLSCGFATFVDSAVEWEGCSVTVPTFSECSCCTGRRCPSDVTSCENLTELCTKELFSGGISCGDRNPVCANYNRPTRSPTMSPTPNPAKRPTLSPSKTPTALVPVKVQSPTQRPILTPIEVQTPRNGNPILEPMAAMNPTSESGTELDSPTDTISINSTTLAILVGVVSMVVLLLLVAVGVLVAKVFGWCCFKPKQTRDDGAHPRTGETTSTSRLGTDSFLPPQQHQTPHAHVGRSAAPPAEVTTNKGVRYKDQTTRHALDDYHRRQNAAAPSVPSARAFAVTDGDHRYLDQ